MKNDKIIYIFLFFFLMSNFSYALFDRTILIEENELLAFVNGTGTDKFIPIWNSKNNTLGDSVISYIQNDTININSALMVNNYTCLNAENYAFQCDPYFYPLIVYANRGDAGGRYMTYSDVGDLYLSGGDIYAQDGYITQDLQIGNNIQTWSMLVWNDVLINNFLNVTNYVSANYINTNNLTYGTNDLFIGSANNWSTSNDSLYLGNGQIVTGGVRWDIGNLRDVGTAGKPTRNFYLNQTFSFGPTSFFADYSLGGVTTTNHFQVTGGNLISENEMISGGNLYVGYNYTYEKVYESNIYNYGDLYSNDIIINGSYNLTKKYNISGYAFSNNHNVWEFNPVGNIIYSGLNRLFTLEYDYSAVNNTNSQSDSMLFLTTFGNTTLSHINGLETDIYGRSTSLNFRTWGAGIRGAYTKATNTANGDVTGYVGYGYSANTTNINGSAVGVVGLGAKTNGIELGLYGMSYLSGVSNIFDNRTWSIYGVGHEGIYGNVYITSNTSNFEPKNMWQNTLKYVNNFTTSSKGNLYVQNNLEVDKNIIVMGCIQYNCTGGCITLGTCI